MLLHLGYPEPAEEASMLGEQSRTDALDTILPVASTADVQGMIDAARALYVEESLNRYTVALLRATRADGRLVLGASPRSGISLLRAAKARALMAARDFVVPDDIKAVAVPVLSHRLILGPEARASGLGGAEIVAETVQRTAVPSDLPVLTNRGRITLFLAAGIYVAGWAFGTWEAYPLALGLAIAVAVAAVTVASGAVPTASPAGSAAAEAVEGGDLPVRVEVRSESGAVPPTAELVEVVQGVRRVTVPLRRGSDGLYGHYTISGPPRGRYGLEPAVSWSRTRSGLQRSESLLEGGQALTVHPRVYELDRLFSDAGSLSGEGRRFLLSRASGYDLHGVRDYQQGESLPAVTGSRRPSGAS
jgi:hypothetical protein